MAIGDEVPRVIHVIEDPSEGSTHHVSPIADVGDGENTAVFSVNGKSRRLVFDVPAPDLAIFLEPVSVTEDGLLLIAGRVENIGDQRALLSETDGSWVVQTPDGLVVGDTRRIVWRVVPRQSSWFLAPPEGSLLGSASPREFWRVVWNLEPGQGATFEVRARPPQGEHRVTFQVRPFGYDRDLSNNEVSAAFDAQLAPLDVVSASTYQLGWPTPQSGLVDIAARIRNRGKHDANVPVGLVFADTVAGSEHPNTALASLPRCEGALEGGCWLELDRAEVAGGSETAISTRSVLPAGEHELVVFAGNPGHGLEAWVGEYFRSLSLQVTAQPPTLLRAGIDARVTGYYADGAARIELTGSLSNIGFRAYREPVPVALECRVGDAVLAGCGEQPAVQMADGYGPAPFAAELRVPVGARVAIEARFGGLARRSIQVTAPGITGPEPGFPDFYQKILRVNGLTVASSASVPDAALFRAGAIANEMLAFNAAVRGALADTHIAIIGRSEVLTEVPELSYLDPEAWNHYRGIISGDYEGNVLVATAEENILCYDDDPHGGYDVLVHEFAHAISVRVPYTPGGQDFWDRLLPAYQAAMDAGLWRRTYAATNPGEYWAEGVQAWFNVQGAPGGITNHINTRAELKDYDPRLAEVIEGVFGAASVTSSCHKPTDDNDFFLLEGKITSAVGEPVGKVNIFTSDLSSKWVGRTTSHDESTSSTAEFWVRLPPGRYQLGFYYYDSDPPGTCSIGFFGPGGWTLDRDEATWIEVSESHTPVIEAIIPESLDDLCGRAVF